MNDRVWNPICISKNREFGSSCMGFITPCCWIDPISWQNGISDPLIANLFTEELRIDNNESIDDIILSDEWISFFKSVYNGPDTASNVCKRFCYRFGGEPVKRNIDL